MFHVKILSKEDIMQVIEMQPVIQCVEDVYKLKSEGDTVVWPTTFYEFDPGHADMDIKSGYLKGAKIFGTRLCPGSARTRKRDCRILSG